MSIRHEVSVLLADGRKLHFTQRLHESESEFAGLVTCLIEEAITGKPLTPAPAGTRWAEWWHHGSPVRRFYSNGLGTVHESTGEKYQNRSERVPGLYSERDALLKIKEKR